MAKLTTNAGERQARKVNWKSSTYLSVCGFEFGEIFNVPVNGVSGLCLLERSLAAGTRRQHPEVSPLL